MKYSLFILTLILGFSGLLQAESAMELKSPDFAHGGAIPERQTCDGENISPALRWTAPPKGTQSLALVMEDPETAKGLKTHWLIYNLAPAITSLPSEIPVRGELAFGEQQGTNDNQIMGYSGPCPPTGETHPYTFRLYALDTVPRLKSGVTRAELLTATEGHILAAAELTGTYSRKE
jgi:Raf kinase inhibitor-like YbhB/YbcL family protein